MKSYLRVRCDKAYLAHVRNFVRDQLTGMEVARNEAEQFVLAVDEACANCMIHQHQCDGYSTIEVSLYWQGEMLFAEIKDSGSPFPLDQYEPREVSDIVRSRGKGGLGINLIQRIMDIVKVEEQPGYSIYRLGKKLSALPLSQSGQAESPQG
jgi:serine/threonine-protein kinase RsbW